ncbi:MAG: cyclic nucleotide-binding domain-containing protein [bacterium]
MKRFEDLIPALVPYQTRPYGTKNIIFKNTLFNTYLFADKKQAAVIQSIDGKMSISDYLAENYKTHGLNFTIRGFYNILIELYLKNFLTSENTKEIEQINRLKNSLLPEISHLKRYNNNKLNHKVIRLDILKSSLFLEKAGKIISNKVFITAFILIAFFAFYTIPQGFAENVLKSQNIIKGTIHPSSYAFGFFSIILITSLIVSFQNVIKMLLLLKFKREINNIAIELKYIIPFFSIDGSDTIMAGPVREILFNISGVLSALFICTFCNLLQVYGFNSAFFSAGTLACLLAAFYAIRPYPGNELIKSVQRNFPIPHLTDHSASYIKKRFLKNFFSFKNLFKGEWVMILFACYFILWHYYAIHYVLKISRTNLPMLLDDIKTGNFWAIFTAGFLSMSAVSLIIYLLKIFFHNLISTFNVVLQKLKRNISKTTPVNIDKNKIKAILGTVPLFAELSESETDNLCENIRVENYPAQTTVITQGEIGEKFYIIASGSAGVYIEHESGMETAEAILNTGDSFGEVALLDDIPRTASVRSLKPLTLLSLHKKYFKSFASNLESEGKNITDIIRMGLFLKNVCFFREMAPEQISKIIKKFRERKVNKFETVISRGESGDKFYVIKNGKFNVFDNGADVPVKVLGKWDTFGEIALIHNIPRTATVKAHTDGSLLELNKDDFLEVLNSNILPEFLWKKFLPNG